MIDKKKIWSSMVVAAVLLASMPVRAQASAAFNVTFNINNTSYPAALHNPAGSGRDVNVSLVVAESATCSFGRSFTAVQALNLPVWNFTTTGIGSAQATPSAARVSSAFTQPFTSAGVFFAYPVYADPCPAAMRIRVIYDAATARAPLRVPSGATLLLSTDMTSILHVYWTEDLLPPPPPAP